MSSAARAAAVTLLARLICRAGALTDAPGAPTHRAAALMEAIAADSLDASGTDAPAEAPPGNGDGSAGAALAAESVAALRALAAATGDDALALAVEDSEADILVRSLDFRLTGCLLLFIAQFAHIAPAFRCAAVRAGACRRCRGAACCSRAGGWRSRARGGHGCSAPRAVGAGCRARR